MFACRKVPLIDCVEEESERGAREGREAYRAEVKIFPHSSPEKVIELFERPATPCPAVFWSSPPVRLARPSQVAFSAWSPADCHHELGRRATCAIVERRCHSNTAYSSCLA